MNLLKIKFLVFLSLLTSCSPTIHKVYTGVSLPVEDVAIVTVSKGISICAVDKVLFKSKVPGINLGHPYIELKAPKTYDIQVWNGEPVILPQNSKHFKLLAEKGKIYQIYCDNCFQEELSSAYLDEVKDPIRIKEIYNKIATGELKRETKE